MEIPDSLAEKLDLWRRRARVVKYREGVFLDASWIAVYLGQGIVPEGWDPRADVAGSVDLLRAVGDLRAEIARDVAMRPDHRGFLARYCPMVDAA
jgi:tryptophan halogenase